MKVALMVTCVNDAMFPDTGRAVVRLLRQLGIDVDVPEAQTCCAQPLVNTGYLDEAVPVVRNFVEAFEGYDAIVTPSGSCAGSIRHQRGRVARRSGDSSLAAAVAVTSPRTYELSECLVDVLGVEDVDAYFPHRVTYHPTCHSLRMLGVGDRPLRLLRAVRGITLVDLPAAEECCGFGGTFALKNAETSVAMGSDKARHVRDTGVPGAVSDTGQSAAELDLLDAVVTEASVGIAVTGTINGSHWRPKALSDVRWKAIARGVSDQVPVVTFHGLRKISGAFGLSYFDEDLYAVARRLGHSNITVTQDHYAYLNLDKAETFADARDQMMSL